jgi:hypothetical protein
MIKGILPETGVALISGQWGTFKTTVALDIALCVMRGLLFANHYRVKRPGAVLYLAVEGEGRLSARLSAIAERRGITDEPLPFAWRGDCPALTDDDAAAELCAMADEAAAILTSSFDLPVALIVVDTMITAAHYNDGGENDPATVQKVFKTLAALSSHAGALVVGIDHFGKSIETGTRGSSGKEGSADAVLALLADRELSGAVKNTRLTVRKQRDGVAGFEVPFTARIVETGVDEDGDSVTAPIVDWETTQETTAPRSDSRWTPSMHVLRRVLTTTLADSGEKTRPFADGSAVPACDIELVRAEFCRQYAAEGSEQQKKETRRRAFNRSVKDATARNLVATREVAGRQWIWLTSAAAA